MNQKQIEQLFRNSVALRDIHQRVIELAGDCLLDERRIDGMDDPSPSQIEHSTNCNLAGERLKKIDALLYRAIEELREAVPYLEQEKNESSTTSGNTSAEIQVNTNAVPTSGMEELGPEATEGRFLTLYEWIAGIHPEEKVRECVRGIQMHNERPIAEDRNGYFLPKRSEEVQRFLAELRREGEARSRATLEEVKAIIANFWRVWSEATATSCPEALLRVLEPNGEKTKLPDEPKPVYRFLEFGERLQQGDEFSPDGGKTWCATHFAGQSVQYFEACKGKYRRKVREDEGWEDEAAGYA